jgi:hypothetical protein
MKKELFVLAIVGIIGMIISLIGILFTQALILSLWGFIVFSIIGCSALVIDKKIAEKEMENKF